MDCCLICSKTFILNRHLNEIFKNVCKMSFQKLIANFIPRITLKLETFRNYSFAICCMFFSIIRFSLSRFPCYLLYMQTFKVPRLTVACSGVKLQFHVFFILTRVDCRTRQTYSNFILLFKRIYIVFVYMLLCYAA